LYHMMQLDIKLDPCSALVKVRSIRSFASPNTCFMKALKIHHLIRQCPVDDREAVKFLKDVANIESVDRADKRALLSLPAAIHSDNTADW
jgi:hypothetical protein